MPRTVKQALNEPKKTISTATILKWFLYLVFLAIPVVLYVTAHQLEKTAPQREAAAKAAAAVASAEYDKAHPWCTQVATYEVRDKAGALVNTERHQEQVRCAPDVQAEKAQAERFDRMDRIVKYVGWGFGALAILLAIIGGGR